MRRGGRITPALSRVKHPVGRDANLLAHRTIEWRTGRDPWGCNESQGHRSKMSVNAKDLYYTSVVALIGDTPESGDLMGDHGDVSGKLGPAPLALAEEDSVLVKRKVASGSLGDSVDCTAAKHHSSSDHERCTYWT